MPALFPTAQKQPGTGAWRIRSRDLGRDREEDLSLRHDGIKDYGDEEGLTAIDVVVKFGGKTLRQALTWLADTLGVRLAKPAKARPAQPEPRADAAAAPAKWGCTRTAGRVRRRRGRRPARPLAHAPAAY